MIGLMLVWLAYFQFFTLCQRRCSLFVRLKCDLPRIWVRRPTMVLSWMAMIMVDRESDEDRKLLKFGGGVMEE